MYPSKDKWLNSYLRLLHEILTEHDWEIWLDALDKDGNKSKAYKNFPRAVIPIKIERYNVCSTYTDCHVTVKGRPEISFDITILTPSTYTPEQFTKNTYDKIKIALEKEMENHKDAWKSFRYDFPGIPRNFLPDSNTPKIVP